MEIVVTQPLPTVIHTPNFERVAKGLFSESDLRALEDAIATRPMRGSVIEGTGGARKVRVALPGMGKRGAARVIYVYIPTKGRVYLLLAYGKNTQDDLTQAQKKALATLIIALKEEA